MTPPDIYSQPDAPDPVLEDGYVMELIARHVPVSSGEVSVDETGGEARTYLCGEFVLKTQRPPRLRARTSLEKEAFILEEIGRQTSLAVPRVVGYGRDEDVEYEVLSRIPGVALEAASPTASARSAILGELGRLLRRWHEIDQSRLRRSPLVPGDAGAPDTVARLRDQFDETRGAVERYADALPDLDQLRETVSWSVPLDFESVVLHSNPGAEHCFIDPRTSTFSGLIDFGDAYRSHPALDVRSWHSTKDSQDLLAGYLSLGPVPSGFMEVWRAGIILTELRLLARGHRDISEASASIADAMSMRR